MQLKEQLIRNSLQKIWEKMSGTLQQAITT